MCVADEPDDPDDSSGDFRGCVPASWSIEDHILGRGRLHPENVSRAGDRIHLATARTTVEGASTFQGAEIRSGRTFREGTFEARMRCDTPDGAICAFFLYDRENGDNADEIDIEVVPGARQIFFVTWRDGLRTNISRREFPPGFDPADAHLYRIEHGPGRTAFYVDERLMASFDSELPVRPMHLYVNAWWPVWLDPGPARSEGRLEVEEIRWTGE